MKVLIYVEPHPIRGSFTHHGWVGHAFAKMIRDDLISAENRAASDIDCRILVTRHQSYELLQDYPELIGSFIGLTPAEDEHIESLLGPWDAAHIERWKDLMAGVGPEADFYRGILERVRSTVFEFDTIAYWGTNATVRQFAQERDVLPVSMELGPTRSPLIETISFDPQGVNGDAISQQSNLDSVPSMSLETIAQNLGVRGLGTISHAIGEPLESTHLHQMDEQAGSNVLIPMQLDDDSNILMHSDYSSMLELLEEVVPKLTQAGYTCFVKPHPGATHQSVNQRSHRDCQRFASKTAGCYWLGDVSENRHYLSLLQKMDMVVTNNSSVGFEAMLLGKVVVPLGRACYTIDGLHPTLGSILEHTFDPLRYRKQLERGLNLLLLHYLVPRSRAFHMHSFAAQLERLEAINERPTSNPTRALLAHPSASLDDYALPSGRRDMPPQPQAPKARLADRVRINTTLLRHSPRLFRQKLTSSLRQRLSRLYEVVS